MAASVDSLRRKHLTRRQVPGGAVALLRLIERLRFDQRPSSQYQRFDQHFRPRVPGLGQHLVRDPQHLLAIVLLHCRFVRDAERFESSVRTGRE